MDPKPDHAKVIETGHQTAGQEIEPAGILWYNNKNVRREYGNNSSIFIMCKGGRRHAGAIEGGCLQSESAASKV